MDGKDGNGRFKPAVVLIDPKYPHNVAAAIRACSCFGVEQLFWTGHRVRLESFKRLPREEGMKGYKEVVWKNEERPFDVLRRTPVCVEIGRGSTPLPSFVHPQDAIYVFGPEDGGVPGQVRKHCHHFTYISARHCLNLAAALNVILYDRIQKDPNVWATFDPAKIECRGEIELPGWDGKA